MNMYLQPLPQIQLDLVGKTRSNYFPWRGQFSPELIENILSAYCPHGAVVLDPFCGSGTLLCEAGRQGYEAIGVELNPSAYMLSKTYELATRSLSSREKVIDEVFRTLRRLLKNGISPENGISVEELQGVIAAMRVRLSEDALVLLNASVVLLDIDRNEITTSNLQTAMLKVSTVLRSIPVAKAPLTVMLGDSRQLGIEDASIDFIVTSPPYINVFNYHQNFRKSTEALGWDLLKIAKSEIGSNRANRGNRFLTVIQYCVDIATTLAELHRVSKMAGKTILVVGRESRVLRVPFYNSQIVSDIATRSGLFELSMSQRRTFGNKFGKSIDEDLLHLERKPCSVSPAHLVEVARSIAESSLKDGLLYVDKFNEDLLREAIDSTNVVSGTPLFCRSSLELPIESKRRA